MSIVADLRKRIRAHEHAYGKKPNCVWVTSSELANLKDEVKALGVVIFRECTGECTGERDTFEGVPLEVHDE